MAAPQHVPLSLANGKREKMSSREWKVDIWIHTYCFFSLNASSISMDRILLVNTGDSRTIIGGKNTVALSTNDHKPSLPSETQRIINARGKVIEDRVDGGLAVSRAFGDGTYKTVVYCNP